MKRFTGKDGFYIAQFGERGFSLRHALLGDDYASFSVWIPRSPLRKLEQRIVEAKQKLEAELSILSRRGLINPLQPPKALVDEIVDEIAVAQISSGQFGLVQSAPGHSRALSNLLRGQRTDAEDKK